MRSRAIALRFVLAIMLAFSLASVGTLGVASADEQGQSQDEAASSKVIRVGYLIDNQDYQSGTPDTYMSGWGYEYLQDISYHTEGWKYEYVLGTFSELIAKHEAGGIDLMSNISYTPERAENLLYSTNPSGKKRYYVYVKPDRGDLTVGDPEALRGKTIGVNPDVLQTTEGKAWLAERGIDVTYKEYATGGEVFSALSSGEVDVIIMNDVLSSDDAMPVFYVGESDYYFTVPKSRPGIMAELDAAMAQILTSNPHYNDEFKARYSAINVGSSSLTDRERDWLASCDNTVTVGYLDNLRPYSLRDMDNQMEGALSVVVSDMRERFGITVNERAYSSNSDLEAALGRGEIDVALPFAKDYWIAEQEGYAQSDSLASSSLVALYKGDDLGSALSSIVVQPNSIVSESLLRSRYPDAGIIMCDNASACFDALSSGRAQAAIIPVMALDVVRSQNDLLAYKTAELPGTVRLTAWMRQDAPTLLAIVNKSIANSQDNITAGTYTAQSYGETETTLVRFVRLYQGAFVAGVDVVLVGIMAILAWSLLRAPERHAGSADAEGECDVSGMRVLLAEDNDLNLEIATTLLADEGVAITCAANGREAFDTFVDRPAGSFDAILMDIMMPVMDGYEAARATARR